MGCFLRKLYSAKKKKIGHMNPALIFSILGFKLVVTARYII
jgi:hypothetical protein